MSVRKNAGVMGSKVFLGCGGYKNIPSFFLNQNTQRWLPIVDSTKIARRILKPKVESHTICLI